MISCVLILNCRGEILVHRDYKGDVTRLDCLAFCQNIVASKEMSERPVQTSGNCTFVHVPMNDLFIVAGTKSNANVGLIFKVLYKLVDIFRSYFTGITHIPLNTPSAGGPWGRSTTTSTGPSRGAVDENSVRRNFVLIYELLDEAIDGGYAQILEVDVLKKYITQGEKNKLDLNNQETLKRITVQATGSCSWRAEGIRYRKNEVYIDVVESVNVLLSQRGQVLRADVSGQILVKCLLSGMPECKFGMNDKLVMYRGAGTVATQTDSSTQQPPSTTRGIALDDCRFHQCVRLSKFDLERTITFVPPDGSFELMTYRITENINLPFKIIPVIQERGRTRMEYSLKAKTTFGKNLFATNVVVKIPCPKHTAKVHISSCSAGKARFESTSADLAVYWRIRRFPGDSEYTLLFEVELASVLSEAKWASRPPIGIEFQVPMFTASGMCVRFLKIQDKSNYKPVKWIRYITRAGSYQHRI